MMVGEMMMGEMRERSEMKASIVLFFQLYFWKFRVVLLGPMLPTGTLLRSCLMVTRYGYVICLGLAYFTEKSRTSCQLLPFFTRTLFIICNQGSSSSLPLSSSIHLFPDHVEMD